MKVLVFGAGAIGGYLGAILSAAGEDVTLVARGAQYEALSTKGITLEGPRSGRPAPVKVKACRPGEEKGPYDVVFVTLKSQQLAEVAQHLRGLIAADGVFVFPQNGLPWWYFDGLDSPYRGRQLKTLDPEGVLANTFAAHQIIGGVSLKPSDLVSPGHIRLADGENEALVMGEINNQMTPRLEALGEMLTRAGWTGKTVADIRKAKWNKLLSNAVWNPLGAITQSTAKEVASFAGTQPLAASLMREVIAVAAGAGMALDADADTLVANAAKRPSIPSSTLQDVLAGRGLEMDAIVNAVIEMGQITGVSTPSLAVVAACVNLLNRRILDDAVAIRPVRK
jgi:2-dehydropantoate 2-reductase